MWETLLKTAIGEIQRSDEELDDLFLRHTYLSIIVAIIVQARFGIDIKAVAEDDPLDLLKGQGFRAATGIQGVLESDFFAWPTEAGGEWVIRDIARRAARFDWRHAPPDIAAILYESVIPADERRHLGEYYTPQWLAKTIVDETVENPLEQRVLDPACGSGTFLVEAIARFLTASEQAGLSPQERLNRLIESVAGVDIHPVAVHLARAAWVIAAKPAIEAVVESGASASVSVPVYLGDSLLLRFPGLRAGDMISESEVRIPVDDDSPIDDLVFPRSLVDRANSFDQLMSAAARAIESGADPLPLAAGDDVKPDERSAVEAALATMRRLHDEGRNHIWAYFTRNLVRPLVLSRQRVDVIVGNPPWITYNKTIDVLREQLERMSRQEYGIWAGGRYATHQDVAGLFYARCVDLYLKDGGVIGMVMPHSALQTGQHSKWRTGEWKSTTGGRGFTRLLAVQFSWRPAWDLERLEPNDFFPIPASVVFARRAGENAKGSPLAGQALRWLGISGAPDVRRESIAITDTSGGSLSPYGGLSTNGATIVPRRLFFVAEVESQALVQTLPLVTVKPRISSLDKKPWKDINLDAITETPIEREHLFDVHLGETVAPYVLLPPLEALLPLKQGDLELPADKNGVGGLDVSALGERMQSRWRTVSRLWDSHKAKANELDVLGRLDYHRELSSQLGWRRDPDGRPVRIVYASSGKPTAALLGDDAAIVDNTLFWVTCRDRDEADYLLAIINSDALYQATIPFMPKGLFGARHVQKHLWKLPIPAFDPGDELHMEIASTGAAAAEGAAALYAELCAEAEKHAKGPPTVTLARRELRNWLAASDEGGAVEDAVGRLLRV